jgi:HipA-like C-terminal domain
VDDHAKFQDLQSPRDSRRPSAYKIAELLGSLQGEGHPVAGFVRRLTFSVLLGDNDARAKNLGILHLPGRSVLADVYDAVPNLFQEGRIDCNLALAIDGSFDHRRISAIHLIREAESWSALRTGEAEQVVTTTLADFAKALDPVLDPSPARCRSPSTASPGPRAPTRRGRVERNARTISDSRTRSGVAATESNNQERPQTRLKRGSWECGNS